MAVKKAHFGGGCFWCIEEAFGEVEGVESTRAGYTGGEKADPSYADVCKGDSGHFEAVEVKYDDEVVSFSDLLDIFWRNIDPTDEGGQFNDRGSQYETVIFYADEEEQKLAEKSKKKIEKKFGKVATKILPRKRFYEADESHQQYYENCPIRYKLYKKASGRQEYLKKAWEEE